MRWSIEAVGHQFEAKRGGGEFNRLDLGGADVNAVVSHVGHLRLDMNKCFVRR